MDACQTAPGRWGRVRAGARWFFRAVAVLLVAPMCGLACGLLVPVAGRLWYTIFPSPKPSGLLSGLEFLLGVLAGFVIGTLAVLIAGAACCFRRKGRAAAMFTTFVVVVSMAVSAGWWLVEDLRSHEPRTIRMLEEHLGVRTGRR
jgi:hypothetical protein